MTEQSTPSTQGTKASTASAGTGGTAVVGPLTIRDLAVLGSVVLIFIASLIPLLDIRAGSLNLWNTTNLFYMSVGMILPLATAALFVIRRFSPGTKLRLGSLSLDQFASVVAVFSAFFYFASITTNFRAAYLVGIIGGVLFMLSTVCAPWIPVLAADFTGRADTPAHVVARDAAAPAKRKTAPKPVVNAGTFGAPGAPNGFGAQGAPAGAAGAAGAAVSAAQGAPDAAAGWVGNRPNQAHTAAGQIFTPAKDERPGAAGGSAGSAAGASAGPGAAAGSAAASAAEAATTAMTTTGPGTSGAAVSSTPADAQETAKDASAAESDSAVAGASSASAPSSSSASGHSADDKDAQAPASETSESSSAGLATTLNPQLAKPGQDRSDTDQGTTAEAASSTTSEAAAPIAPKVGEAAPATSNNAPAKESITATVDPKAATPAVSAEPFWFAVDRPQNVIDEQTRQFIYKLTPGSWILALEDRGNSFLVQDSRGKTGLLLDLVGIERASDSH